MKESERKRGERKSERERRVREKGEEEGKRKEEEGGWEEKKERERSLGRTWKNGNPVHFWWHCKVELL